jgi:hypothetical protein
VIAKVDGEPVAGSPVRDALVAAGFAAGYAGTPSARRPPGRCAEAMPEATRSPAPPRDVHTSSAASRGARARAPGPQVDRIGRSTVTAVDAMGKTC